MNTEKIGKALEAVLKGAGDLSVRISKDAGNMQRGAIDGFKTKNERLIYDCISQLYADCIKAKNKKGVFGESDHAYEAFFDERKEAMQNLLKILENV